jgi:putative DNA primase/helicase
VTWLRPTPLEVAMAFTVERGWRTVPVPYRSKAPVIKGWQRLQLSPAELPSFFNSGQGNIGVLNGEPSGIIDTDLDCREAVLLADSFLPPTPSRWGRKSKRASHRIYAVTTPGATEQFEDVELDDDGKPVMLVELRSTGSQTVAPGSVHPSGEPIEWDEDGVPAPVDDATLRRAIAHLAAACLLARHWPAEGGRHAVALAAAGLLVTLPEADIVRILFNAARAAGDEEARYRKADVFTTIAKHRAGEPVVGGPTLAELLRGDGVKVVSTLRRWLGQQTAAVAEPLTDVTNAARFVDQHGADLRFCYAWASWLVFDGRRWRRDAGDVSIRCAKETARGWFAEAAQASDDASRKALARWATYSSSEPGLRRMLTLAQAELAITPDQLDANPWLLNCPNGTLELRTAHLRPHRREDFITKMTAAIYDPTARLPMWDTYLESAMPDAAARAYAQRYAGYALTGDTREDVFVFARGPAGGGKSTLIEGLRRTWGDYATSADFSTFLVKRSSDGPREDIARLAGTRLVTSVETRDGQAFAEGVIKLLTGGDTVAARRLYERTFEFAPAFKLLLASNFRPRANAEDDGLWRRLRELPFPVGRPHRADRDEQVRLTLIDPAQAGSAILAWAVDGCTEWLTHGLGEPDVVMQATAAYRKSQEPLAEFVADCCHIGSGYSVPAARLREVYESWCKAEGIKYPVGGRTWGNALRALGCADRRGHGGVRWWDGIDVRLDESGPGREPGEDDPPCSEAVGDAW